MPLLRIICMVGLLLITVGFAQAGGYIGLFLSGCLGFMFMYIVVTSLWIHRGHIYAVRSIRQQRLQAGDRAEVTITINLPRRYWLCWIVVEERWIEPKSIVEQKQQEVEVVEKQERFGKQGKGGKQEKRKKQGKQKKQARRELQKLNSERYACLAYIQGSRAIKCHYTTSAKARGIHRVHSSCVMIGDMFGIVKRVLIQDEQECELVQVNAVPLAGDWIHRIQQDGAVTADYGTLRDYISGDPISSIDWKSYARYQSLKTKQLEAEEQKSLLIVMDARKPYFELIVSAVTRIMMEPNDRSIQTLLVCGESRCSVNPLQSYETGLSNVVFDWLASIEATSVDSFTEQLSKAITRSIQSVDVHTNQLTMESNCSIIGLTHASNERIVIDNGSIAYEHNIKIVYVDHGVEASLVQASDRVGELSYA